MSRGNQLDNEIFQLTYSINPATALPYSTNTMQVADGQGLRRWQSVFQTISSQSATDGAPLGYLPSTIRQISNDTSTFSTIVATSYSTLSTMIGTGGIPGGITGDQLQSTTRWIQDSSRYISTGNLVSSMTPFLNGTLSFMSNIQSTVVGLGSSRYVSTLSLQSTVATVTGQIVSTTRGLGATGYVSSPTLTSTFLGLGSAGYASTATLFSTVQGLIYPASAGGSLGLVVAGSTDPPYLNFSTLSSNYLVANNYITPVNAPNFGFVYGSDLPSTTNGLISTLSRYGYVSTATLLSTSAGIQAAKQNVFVDRTGNVTITNSQVFLSSVGAITFLSSFVNSTLNYAGTQGSFQGLATGNSNLYFSTASLQLDRFSSLIVSSSRITVEVYPTFMFDPLTAGALQTKLQPISTFVQYGPTLLSSFSDSRIVCGSATAGFSNSFQQPIKLNLQGSTIAGNYANPYVLAHQLPGGLSFGLNVGFRDSNVTAFYGSTNSYFLSVQNLSF